MIGRFPYGTLAKYPHLNTADRDVWVRYIGNTPNAFDSVDYDFTLDEQSGATETAAQLGIGGAERVFKYRVDVIGYKGNEIFIIELKDKADSSAIGQVAHYRDIYIEDEKPTGKVSALIIAGSATPRLDEFLRVNNVSLTIV